MISRDLALWKCGFALHHNRNLYEILILVHYLGPLEQNLYIQDLLIMAQTRVQAAWAFFLALALQARSHPAGKAAIEQASKQWIMEAVRPSLKRVEGEGAPPGNNSRDFCDASKFCQDFHDDLNASEPRVRYIGWRSMPVSTRSKKHTGMSSSADCTDCTDFFSRYDLFSRLNSIV